MIFFSTTEKNPIHIPVPFFQNPKADVFGDIDFNAHANVSFSASATSNVNNRRWKALFSLTVADVTGLEIAGGSFGFTLIYFLLKMAF